MVATKSIDEVTKKWVDVTPGRAPYYDSGIKSPKKDWEAESAKQEDAYEGGVTEAIARKAYGKGVHKAGTATWSEGSITKGIPRYGPGVRAAEEKYKTNFSPYLDEISRISLPPRGPRGDPRNYERVIQLGDALKKKRLSLLG